MQGIITQNLLVWFDVDSFTSNPAGSQKAANKLQAAMDRFEAAGGYDADKRIANVLTGLGFKQGDWSKHCSEFSGGWQVHSLSLLPCNTGKGIGIACHVMGSSMQ